MKTNRIFILAAFITMLLSVQGCSGGISDISSSEPASASTQDGAEAPAGALTDTSAAEEETSTIPEEVSEIAEFPPDGELSVPSYLKGSETDGFSVVKERGDSTAYRLTAAEWQEAADRIAEQTEKSVAQVLGDKEYYPHITEISMNQDCSVFDVTFSDAELNIYETTLRMSLYIAGDKFQLFHGESEDNILTVVNYIDGSTGKVFSTGDSGELH